MGRGIVLRRSARDAIMWHFHVVLDSVPEGAGGREEFVRRMLGEFGVTGTSSEDIVNRACKALPKNLKGADMLQVLAAFEQAIPIEWEEDRTSVPEELECVCTHALQHILAERPQGTLPKAVTAQMIDELKRILGPSLNDELVPALTETMRNQLINDMWRSLDKESQQDLAERLMYSIRHEGRIRFGRE